MVSTLVNESKLTSSTQFNESEVLELLKHYLPTQTPLKDFIHHNSLHAFQKSKFYDAIFQASEIFGFHVTLELNEYRKLIEINRISESILNRAICEIIADNDVEQWKEKVLYKNYSETFTPQIGALRANWKKHFQIDLDSLVQPLLFRILCSYLDQGISSWKFPIEKGGFLESLQALENNSKFSLFKTNRARLLFLNKHTSIKELLDILVGKEEFYTNYLLDMQFSHRGWSGMVAAIESNPSVLLDTKLISLKELILFELLLEIDALESTIGNNFTPLGEFLFGKPVDLFTPKAETELIIVLKILQNAFEWSYYDEVLAGIREVSYQKTDTLTTPTFQAIFCIDERECSLRRHVESCDKQSETLGSPGFFGVEFYFQPQGAKFYDKLCPAPVTPKYLIKESNVSSERPHDVLYDAKVQTLFGGLTSTFTLGFAAAARLFLNLFSPKMSPAISNAFAHMDKSSVLTIENKHLEDRENDLQIGFTLNEMTQRVEALLRGIGLTQNFGPLVYVVAHGSSSANNPHHGAHDCGACSGRPGSVNARVFAAMANHPKVRLQLQQKGISIPSTTQFIGALHDTAADEIEFYDESVLSDSNKNNHRIHQQTFEKALDLNAKERSRRFASIKTKSSLTKVRQAIKERSVSLFEPRPELGHGTNTLCIVGRRELTKKLFLDRRAFLNSYDYRSDLEGNFLTGIMRPLGPVCGGINLEYYFSRVDNYKLGAGTKLPHHVMGLFGVANSCDGDLRPGLPLQMIEVHDPVRLLIVVEHFPEVILKSIQSSPDMYEWFINEWVHLIAFHPETKQTYRFKNGAFHLHSVLHKTPISVNETHSIIEQAKEMESNWIVDATLENLPVYTLN